MVAVWSSFRGGSEDRSWALLEQMKSSPMAFPWPMLGSGLRGRLEARVRLVFPGSEEKGQG